MLWMIALAVQLVVLYTAGRRLNSYLAGRAIEGSRLRRLLIWLLMAPGVVAHELSHFIMALAVGARVSKFVPFRPQQDPKTGELTLGYVESALPRNPAWRAMVGMAPLFMVPTLVYLLGCALVPGTALGDSPYRLLVDAAGHPHHPGVWAFAFAYLSASLGLLPSPTDHADLPAALLIVGAGTAVSLWAGAGPALVEEATAPARFMVGLLLVPSLISAGWALAGKAKAKAG